MLGQLWVEPELELLEPEPDELEDPELVLPVPVLELLELDDGVVVEVLVPALEPVVPVLDELVVAASATSAPPVTRPVVSAPIANTFRSRIFMVVVLSIRVMRHSFRSGSHTLRPGPVAGRTTTAACWLRFPTIG
jgi:hypothetical protein